MFECLLVRLFVALSVRVFFDCLYVNSFDHLFVRVCFCLFCVSFLYPALAP